MKTTIQRKITDIQALANDTNIEVIDALSSIDGVIVSGNVRSSLEAKELANLHAFIDSFSSLTTIFDNVFKSIDSLDCSCDSMLKKLSIGEKGVDEVLDMTTSLHTQQEKQMQQLNRIHSFVDEYYLNQADIDLLNAGDVNDAFFETFAKLETAHEKTTNALRISQSSCLLDVSASLNKLKENAYQRMYHWLHMNSHLFDAKRPSISTTYDKCLTIIKVKSLFYQFIVDEIAKVRSGVIGRAFLKALSAGEGDNKPLESSAGIDPLQFVGDLFAWIHQITATESAFLANLFKEKPNSKIIKTAMATVFDSVVRPLEVRITQSINTLTRPIDLYQIANICSFFANTFSDICGVTSSLCRISNQMKLMAGDSFKKKITETVANIRSLGTPTLATINESLGTLSEIAAMHKQSSLSASFDISSLIENFVNGVISAVHESGEPVINQVNAMISLYQISLDANLKNQSSISEEINKDIKDIVAFELDELYNKCRIKEILTTCDIYTDQPLSTLHGMEPDILGLAIKRYETALTGSGPISTPVINQIKNSEPKKCAKATFADRLVSSYEKLFNVVIDPKNGYSTTRSVFSYTPQLVKDLIKIE